MNISEYVQKRINKLKEHMVSQDIDTVILMKPENTFYFSNFNPVINSQPIFVIVSLKKETCLLVHCIRCDHAKEEGAIENVQLFGKWGKNVSLAIDPIDAIHEIIGDEKISLGLELDYVNFSLYEKINDLLQVRKVSNVSNQINSMKIIKDEHEIDCIRKSAHLVDNGIQTTIEYLEKGYSEAEACTEGQYKMRKLWQELYPDSEVCGFGTSEGGYVDSLQIWSMANEKIAYGCDCPKHYFPKSGDIVLPMAWAKIDGYYAENERVIAVDQLDSNKNKAYDAILKARENIFKILKPGVSFESLYFEATKVFEEYGFGSILPGRTGHGIGLSAHEYPSMTKGNTIVLAPGMIFTVEPGLMDKQWGGARHSDTVLVTQDGYERLTTLRNDKITVHIGK